MKKFLSAAILTVCCIALSQQQAAAWVNSKFSFGMEWQHQSGGNSICKGLWRNGQPPGPEALGFAPNYQYSQSTAPQSHASFDAFEYGAPAYAMPMPQYTPFQFATYPRFEYPSPYSGR